MTNLTSAAVIYLIYLILLYGISFLCLPFCIVPRLFLQTDAKTFLIYMYLLPNCLSWNVLWKLELLTFSRELYVYDNSLANVWMRKVVLLMSICPQDLNFGINLFCHDETFTKIKSMAILNFKSEVYWRKTNRTIDFKTTLPFFQNQTCTYYLPLKELHNYRLLRPPCI